MGGDFKTETTYDKAVIAWANDFLDHSSTEPSSTNPATGVFFGYEVNCWSEWTCDYEVTMTIEGSNGEHVETYCGLPEVLRKLPQYVEAEIALTEAHREYH